MSATIFGAPLGVLRNYLDEKTYLRLFKLYPEKRPIIYNDFKNLIIGRIEKRLSEGFGYFWEDIKKALIQDRIVISGSFILECILNENFEDIKDENIIVKIPDLDLFMINDKKYNNLEKNLSEKNNYYFHSLNTFDGDIKIEHYLKNINKIEKIVEYRKKGIFWLNNITNKNQKRETRKKINNLWNKKIQIIKLGVNSVNEIIASLNKSFDFDVCKNVFFYDENGNPQLIIGHINQVIKKRSKYKLRYDDDFKLICRINKYLSRGYYFIPEKKIKLRNSDDLFNFYVKRKGFTSHKKKYLSYPEIEVMESFKAKHKKVATKIKIKFEIDDEDDIENDVGNVQHYFWELGSSFEVISVSIKDKKLEIILSPKWYFDGEIKREKLKKYEESGKKYSYMITKNGKNKYNYYVKNNYNEKIYIENEIEKEQLSDCDDKNCLIKNDFMNLIQCQKINRADHFHIGNKIYIYRKYSEGYFRNYKYINPRLSCLYDLLVLWLKYYNVTNLTNEKEEIVQFY
tara:strand:+ start:942 stop:2483 length:1542 start_codon:yes stop_codon:yes gene_type:complete